MRNSNLPFLIFITILLLGGCGPAKNDGPEGNRIEGSGQSETTDREKPARPKDDKKIIIKAFIDTPGFMGDKEFLISQNCEELLIQYGNVHIVEYKDLEQYFPAGYSREENSRKFQSGTYEKIGE